MTDVAMIPASASARHPRGLPILFFTEMWERFSFYTMSSLLALYMDERLHFSHGLLSQVYGLYNGLVYFLPFFGGLLADRKLGFHRAVIAGGILMMLGHLTLAIESVPFFFTALVLLIFGSGLLKPNISTILGELYADRPQLRDSGYNIFYMGINIGALAAPLSAALLETHFGWSIAFASAGVGMFISLIIFIAGLKVTGYRADRLPSARATRLEETAAEISPRETRRRVGALLAIFGIVTVFWMAFYQYAFTMTFWVRDNVRTSLPPEVSQSIEPFYIILFTPLLVGIWAALRRRGREPKTPMKMLLGMLWTAAAFLTVFVAGRMGGDTGRVSAAWIFGFYAWVAMGEICVSPMGLSLVSRVAPPRMRGMMMGAWFVATGLGAYLSGAVGYLWYKLPHSSFFLLFSICSLIAAVLLAILNRPLNRVFDRAN